MPTKLTILFVSLLLLSANTIWAKEPPAEFKIDFRCCGVYVNCWDPPYSNAVLQAIYPHFVDFARKLDLPQPQIKAAARFLPQPQLTTKDQVEGGGVFNGHTFGFAAGHVCFYSGPDNYSSFQDFSKLDQAYGAPTMTKQEVMAMARHAIKKLGHSLEDVLAEYDPMVLPLETNRASGKILPYYHLHWIDPRSGGAATKFEINARTKTIQYIQFNRNLNLKRPAPKITVEPAPLDPANPVQKVWIAQNDWTNTINHDYAYRLVPVVFKAVEEWVTKLHLDVPLPITSNQVRRFYCSNEGDVARVELSLTNNWEFIYNCCNVTYAASPRRFFESDSLPFRIKTFAGTKRLTDAQAIELVRKAVAKLGPGPEITHVDAEPTLIRPTTVTGMPTIPRLIVEWVYPNRQEARSVWIRAEVDCDKGTVETLQYDVTSLWKKGPDLGIPIDNLQNPSSEKPQ